MKSLIYISLALAMGGSVWYSFSSSSTSEEVLDNKKISKIVNPQNNYNSSEKKTISSIKLINNDEKSTIFVENVNKNNIIKELEHLKKTAKTKVEKEKYEKMQTLYKDKLANKLTAQARYSQSKANYERQQFLAKQQNNTIDARKNYLALQQAMKNRNVNSANSSSSSVIKAQVARENYINKQKEIIQRMKAQSK